MKSKNLRAAVSFRNDERDYKIFEYLQKQRDKSSFIKDLLEREMLKAQKEKDVN